MLHSNRGRGYYATLPRASNSLRNEGVVTNRLRKYMLTSSLTIVMSQCVIIGYYNNHIVANENDARSYDHWILPMEDEAVGPSSAQLRQCLLEDLDFCSNASSEDDALEYCRASIEVSQQVEVVQDDLVPSLQPDLQMEPATDLDQATSVRWGPKQTTKDIEEIQKAGIPM